MPVLHRLSCAYLFLFQRERTKQISRRADTILLGNKIFLFSRVSIPSPPFTRLSLDALRVLRPAFSFASLLATGAVSILLPPFIPRRQNRCCPVFSGFMRVCGLLEPEFSRALHRRYPNPEIRYFSLCGAFRPFFRAKGSAFLRFEDNSSPRNR